jgi:hypothetical protein
MSSTLDRLLGTEEPIEPTHELPQVGKNYNDKLPHSHMGNLMKRRQELSQRSFTPTPDSESEASSYLSSELGYDWHGQDSNTIMKKLAGGGGEEGNE